MKFSIDGNMLRWAYLFRRIVCIIMIVKAMIS